MKSLLDRYSFLTSALASLSMLATFEIFSWVAMVYFSLLSISFFFRGKLKPWVLFVFWSVLSLFFWKQFSDQLLHPIQKVAQIALCTQALLFFLDKSTRNQKVLLAFSFVLTILSISLSPELYLFFFAFLFFLFSSFQYFFLFLNEKDQNGEIASSFYDHSKAWWKSILLQSLFMVLCAFLLFPLLPRVKSERLWFSRPSASVGLSDELKVQEQFLVENTSSQVVLRVYSLSEDSEDIENYIPHGLIRVRDFSRWTTDRWIEDWTSSKARSRKTPKGKIERFSLIQESSRIPYFGVFYGTESVQEDSEFTLIPPTLESKSNKLQNQRIQYELTANAHAYGPWDPPSTVHLEIPKKYRVEQMKNLAKTIFQDTKSTKEKLVKIEDFFKKNNYEANTFNSQGVMKTTTMLDFIQNQKKGHCELFASASAYFLRLEGVPARIVSGYRLSKASLSGVLTVRSSDAHAWVEAWSESDQRWLVFDPTPRVFFQAQFVDFIQSYYDLWSAYFTVYVLQFRFADLFKHQESVIGFFSMVLIVVALFYLLYRLHKFFKIPKEIRWKRKIESLLPQSIPIGFYDLPQNLKKELESWFELYESLRFSKLSSSKVQKRSFISRSKEVYQNLHFFRKRNSKKF